jgi:hypothetical protein
MRNIIASVLVLVFLSGSLCAQGFKYKIVNATAWYNSLPYGSIVDQKRYGYGQQYAYYELTSPPESPLNVWLFRFGTPTFNSNGQVSGLDAIGADRVQYASLADGAPVTEHVVGNVYAVKGDLSDGSMSVFMIRSRLLIRFVQKEPDGSYIFYDVSLQMSPYEYKSLMLEIMGGWTGARLRGYAGFVKPLGANCVRGGGGAGGGGGGLSAFYGKGGQGGGQGGSGGRRKLYRGTRYNFHSYLSVL